MKKYIYIVLFLSIVLQAVSAVNAQTIRKVEILGPAIGNAPSNEIAVVNSTGLVYKTGQAFGGNIGVFDPNTNTSVKVIRSDANDLTTYSFSGVNQATNIVYFASPFSSSPKILAVDGSPSSPTFNQATAVDQFSKRRRSKFCN